MAHEHIDWSKVDPRYIIFEGEPCLSDGRFLSDGAIVKDILDNQKRVRRMNELKGGMLSAADALSVLRDNVAGTIFSDIKYGSCVDDAEIDCLAVELGCELADDYRAFVRQIGYLHFRNDYYDYGTNVYGLGGPGTLSVLMRTRDARQSGRLPSGVYVINRITGKSIFPDKSLIVQDATGLLSMVFPDGSMEAGWKDLMEYVTYFLNTSFH